MISEDDYYDLLTTWQILFFQDQENPLDETVRFIFEESPTLERVSRAIALEKIKENLKPDADSLSTNPN